MRSHKVPQQSKVQLFAFTTYLKAQNIEVLSITTILHPLTKQPYIHLGIWLVSSLNGAYIKKSHYSKNKNKQIMTLLLSPASLHWKIKILNSIICPSIKYMHFMPPFHVPNIKKLDKLLIKLINSICDIPKHSLTSLSIPLQTFNIEAFSLLPNYATTLYKQLTHTLNDPNPLGQIHQGTVKFIASGVHSLVYFAYTCDNDLFKWGLFTYEKWL